MELWIRAIASKPILEGYCPMRHTAILDVMMLALVLLMGLFATGPLPSRAQQGATAAGEPVRISAADVYQSAKEGKATLVCAYKQEEICRSMWIDGAVSLSEFESRLPGLAKDHAIIFYCGSGVVAGRVAGTYLNMGYTNIKVLDGGIAAWKKAGYTLAGEK